MITPRALAAHWIAHKDAEYIEQQAALYAKPEELKKWVKLYLAQIKKLRFKDK